jgi:ketosteroid isomerase-like protein
MTNDNRALVDRMLRAFEAKDMQETLACFTEEALLIDPHYPNSVMQGKAAIQEGLEFAFGMLKQPDFEIRHFWSQNHTGALEVTTRHVFQDGTEAKFQQVFVFETQNGLFTRFQVYVPDPPPAK